MTEQEINQQIAADIKAMNEAPFPEPLPDWLLDNFDKIIMEVPQKDVPYFAETVRCVLAKRPNELTFYEGGFVLNVWTAVAPKYLSKNINTFLDRKGIAQRIMYRYNQQLEREQGKLDRKKASLMKLVNGKKILTTV